MAAGADAHADCSMRVPMTDADMASASAVHTASPEPSTPSTSVTPAAPADAGTDTYANAATASEAAETADIDAAMPGARAPVHAAKKLRKRKAMQHTARSLRKKSRTVATQTDLEAPAQADAASPNVHTPPLAGQAASEAVTDFVEGTVSAAPELQSSKKAAPGHSVLAPVEQILTQAEPMEVAPGHTRPLLPVSEVAHLLAKPWYLHANLWW